MSVRGYQLALDWDRTGDYTGPHDDASSAVDNDDIVITYGRDETAATGKAATGKLAFSLANLARVYSPENTASPIAGKVTPGTPTRFQVTHDGTIHTLHEGWLDDVEADPGAAAHTVTGQSLDGLAQLGAEPLSTPLYRGLRTGDAINLILDEVGWTGPRDIDPGATVMPWWWAEGISAADAVDRLVQAEGPPAIAYVAGGVFTYRDRHHRLTYARSMTSQAVFTHIEPAGTGPAGDYKIDRGSFRYDHGLRGIANSVTFEVPQRAPAAAIGEVWSSDDILTVINGETVAVEAKPSDPFLNAQPPEPDVDYIVSSGSVTVALSRDSGQSVTLLVTAVGGDAVVSRLAVRATSVPVARTVKVTAEDTASINASRRSSWPDEVPFANSYDAQAIARRIVAVYGTNRPSVSFSISYAPGRPSRYLEQILSLRISDRVTVRNDRLGLNADFMVERLTHRIRKLGLIHRLEIGCQIVDPVQASNAITFNVAGKGFNDGSFGIDGIDNPATMLRFDTAGKGFNQGQFGT